MSRVLFLSDADVEAAVSMDDALNAVRGAFIAQSDARATNIERHRIRVDQTGLAVQGAIVDNSTCWIGTKINASTPEYKRSWSVLFDDAAGLTCIAHAERLGQLRTAAATGVSTDVLARDDATVLTIIGTGFHAYTQVEAIARLRPSLRVLACGRTPAHVDTFVERVRHNLGLDADACEDVDGAVARGDVVVTATRASEPVLHGRLLRQGSHVALVGSNNSNNREADSWVFSRARTVYTDDIAQARIEGGDILGAVREGALNWNRVELLAAAVADAARNGTGSARTDRQAITVFSSHGVGLWDTAILAAAFRRAIDLGVGTFLPLDGAPGPSRR